MITSLNGPIIEAIRIPIAESPRKTRSFITQFLDSPDGKVFLENPDGAPAVFICDNGRPLRGLAPLGHEFAQNHPQELELDQGDLLIVQARPNTPFHGGSTPLGNLRLALSKAAIASNLIPPPDPNATHFLWITDFPLFTPTTANDTDPGQGGAAGLTSTHHPFTAPKTPADIDLLLTRPLDAKAAHYDIVLNGVELGGGSRRIHSAAIQRLIFADVLRMPASRVAQFEHLLRVLGSGCPPHAGIALGWDRLCAALTGSESVRDVIAFPKSGRGEDVLVGSPNGVSEEQARMYHLRVGEKGGEAGV